MIHNATYPRSACPQIDQLSRQYDGNEDCLYLNVYRPNYLPKKKLLPVLVFIHGGSFTAGSADPSYFGPDYLMDTQEVVVVTINYRLGVLGFMASGDASCKGNFGLKDQNMALQWIHDNIRVFSGNPHRVTIMGESAGAASVHYHMMSKRSDGLFKKGILSSGTALAFWALQKDPKAFFQNFAALTGVTGKNTDEMIAEFRKMSTQELVAWGAKLPGLHPASPNFRPVVEGNWPGAFITEDPAYIWESGKYQQRPFLIGMNGYEEGVFHDLYYNEAMRNGILANFDQGVAAGLELPQQAVQVLKDFYFNGQPTEENIINVLGVSLAWFTFVVVIIDKLINVNCILVP